ncbi:MAG TPA: DUF3185 domain-containing protein [Acidobacteriota bacterium]|jgi:uncharacterized membrane protein|nr:DUF3185 domain-containing protein [Acidobacteriota bacterium]
MRPSFIVGIILIILGTLALAYQGFSYTTEEKIAEIGPVEATADKEESISIPPVLGGVALAGGVILVLLGARRR